MKKTLLIGAALLVGVTSFAQNNRSAVHKTSPAMRQHKKHVADNTSFPVSGTKRASGPVASANTSSIACGSLVTHAVNVLTVSGGASNQCLTYNADLNSVFWTARVSSLWSKTTDPTFTRSSTGSIQATWLNLTTSAWDSMIIFCDSSASYGGRYPGGTILNPVGNTTLSAAYFVASGPHVGASGFDGAYYCARQATGNYHTQPVNNTTFEAIPGSGPFEYLPNTSIFTPAIDVDMQQVGNSVMVTGPLADSTYTETNGLNQTGAIIGIAKTPYVNNNLTWTTQTVVPGFYTDGNKTSGNGFDVDGDARLAFNGQTGYLVFIGRLAQNFGNSADSMMSPIVYKTTNGGTTWAPVLQGYDWRKGHPECHKNVCTGRIRYGYGSGGTYRADTLGSHRYSFTSTHGMDMTVDANGVLHLATCVADPYQDGKYADSLMYGYTYNWDYQNYHPLIWDFMTDGSCWKTMLIDSVMTSAMGTTPANDTTASQGLWYYSPNSDYMGYDGDINLSRSTDGTKIFYGWDQSDINQTSNMWNVAPDLWMQSFDVTTEKLTAAMNITGSTSSAGSAFYPRLSDISYLDNTLNKWVVPAMTTVGTVYYASPVWDATMPVEFHYVNCGTFGASDYSVATTIHPDMTSAACTFAYNIKNNNAFANAVNNYPNPFNQTTNIIVNLGEGKAINLQVYDAIGKLVYTKNTTGIMGENTIVFDASNLNAGVYYYTVTAGYDRVTKKMVIQK